MYSDKEHQELDVEFNKKAQLLNSKKISSQAELENIWHNKTQGKFLADAVFAANDGIITTFAVVAGVAGADLSSLVVIILGAANLLADGASMGLGNYLGKRSEKSYALEQRKKEEWEIDHIPEVERAEVREIFSRQGFRGKDLERAVEIITSDRKIWLDLMMKEELGIYEEERSVPVRHGLVTFFSFLSAGILPLLPYFFSVFSANSFRLSLIMTFISLFIIGSMRSKITAKNFWTAGFEMLILGGVAASIAYLVGMILAKIIS